MNGHRSWTERGLGLFVTLIVLFSTFPLLIIFPVSLNPSPMLAMPSGEITLAWYAKAAQSNFPRALGISLSVAALATIISLLAGSLVAWALSRHPFRGSEVVEAFFLSPLLLARVVYGVAMMIVLTRLHLIRTLSGLIIAHTVIVLPYVVRVVGSSLMGVRRALEDAAFVLGASQAQVLWSITLPLVRPGLIAAGVFAFITSLDEFTMTVFIVGPKVTTLPVQIFRQVELLVDPTVAAVSVVLIMISAIVIFVVERTVGLEKVLQA